MGSQPLYLRDPELTSVWLTLYKKIFIGHSVNRRNLECSIDFETYTELAKAPCYYCNAPPTNIFPSVHSKFAKSRVHYQGIDRVDNSIGYHIENCVSCCRKCNGMKGKLTEQEFLDHIRRIAEHQGWT